MTNREIPQALFDELMVFIRNKSAGFRNKQEGWRYYVDADKYPLIADILKDEKP